MSDAWDTSALIPHEAVLRSAGASKRYESADLEAKSI